MHLIAAPPEKLSISLFSDLKDVRLFVMVVVVMMMVVMVVMMMMKKMMMNIKRKKRKIYIKCYTPGPQKDLS